MKYHLYDEQERHQGKFESVYELRKFLCDRKYDTNCDKDIGCTFDYIKSINGSLKSKNDVSESTHSCVFLPVC